MTTNSAAPSILIVDDELNNRNLMEMRLHSLGYAVETAANGLHALEKLRSNPKAYSVVVSDIKMPGLDGISLAQNIRQDSDLSHIPVIIMTGFPERNLIIKSRENGVKDVLLKPFPFDELLKRLKILIPIIPNPNEAA